MNNRIDHHIDRARRALSALSMRHIPVYGIEIAVDRSRPLIHCGPGPFDWHQVAIGRDRKGAWADYAAHLNGVELHRRERIRITGTPNAN